VFALLDQQMLARIRNVPDQFEIRIQVTHCVCECRLVSDRLRSATSVEPHEMSIDVSLVSMVQPISHVKERGPPQLAASSLVAGFTYANAETWFLSGSHCYTFEQQQACAPDAFRLCSSEIPDVERIKTCMIRNRSQLSPQCRAFFRAGPEPRQEASDAPGRPLSVKPAAAEKMRLHRIRKPRPDDT
jgi:hypothetical protein